MKRWETPEITITCGTFLTGMNVVVTLTQGWQKFDIVPTVDEDNRTLSFRLTQEQTSAFAVGAVQMQVNAIDANGNRIASNVMKFTIGENLHDEEMKYEA